MGLGGSPAASALVCFGGTGGMMVSCFGAIRELLILLKSLRFAPSRTLEGPATEGICALLSMTMTLLKCPQGSVAWASQA